MLLFRSSTPLRRFTAPLGLPFAPVGKTGFGCLFETEPMQFLLDQSLRLRIGNNGFLTILS